MKKSILVIAVLLALVFGSFASGKSEAKGQEIKLTLGHGATVQHPLQDTSIKFATLIKERTNGRVLIDVFPNRQLGEERAMVEGLQLGTIGLTIVSTGPVGGFVPEVGVVDLPFLFKSNEHAYKVLDGDIGQSILAKFEPKGMVGLAFMENGWRSLTCNKKITKPEDLKGLKIRTMENKVHMATFRAMGASPVPMAWGEVYTALQSGIIDGQENPVAIVYTNSLWEVQKYYPQTKHFYTPYVFLMSKAAWDKLSANEQKIFKQTALEMAAFQRSLMNQQLADQVKILKEKGMDVYDVDRSAFQAATRQVYAEFEAIFGKSLIEKIIGAGN
jgi:tripartite ATP-independent transporter DctP family solute receptor